MSFWIHRGGQSLSQVHAASTSAFLVSLEESVICREHIRKQPMRTIDNKSNYSAFWTFGETNFWLLEQRLCVESLQDDDDTRRLWWDFWDEQCSQQAELSDNSPSRRETKKSPVKSVTSIEWTSIAIIMIIRTTRPLFVWRCFLAGRKFWLNLATTTITQTT